MTNNNVPEELLSLPNWVAYEMRPAVDKEGNPTKPKKEPVNPHTGGHAQSSNASTWGDYQSANNRAQMIKDNTPAEKFLGSGIGFMFGEPGSPSGIAGIDLDDCFDSYEYNSEEVSFLMEEFKEIVDLMDSYTEYSPSGQGLHILFRLSRSLHDMRPDIKTGKNKRNEDNRDEGIEIYDSGKYYTYTGEVYGEAKPIEDRTEQVQKFLEKYFPPAQESGKAGKLEATSSPVRAPESDSELWEKMFNAKNGANIRRLYDGDISGYGSPSQADQALLCHLAYWTNNDYSRMESMMGQSVLGQRDKWINRPDYRHRTINTAITRTPEYIPTAPAGDKEQQQTQQAESFIMDAQYLTDSFESDITHFQRYSNRKTGFSNLDDKITLYPGLYVVGAISSLGKTTFCLQLADQLAESGEHVLYFAFEQTRFELISKSLARLCQPEDSLIESLPTAIQIRRGRTSPEVREAMQKYSEIGRRKAVIECDFETDISTVIATVESYIKTYTVKPVVFVDYMQLIRSNNPRLTNTKDIVDNNIRALKKLQMQNELLMFVVSSINRMNYLTPIDFESFKESGAIEYTADVVIGLQLAVMNNKLFETDTKTTKKRRVIKAAKTEKPRNIELCVLKNRYGVSNESFYFEYYPQLELFNPVTSESASRAITKLINSIPDSEEKKPR